MRDDIKESWNEQKKFIKEKKDKAVNVTVNTVNKAPGHIIKSPMYAAKGIGWGFRKGKSWAGMKTSNHLSNIFHRKDNAHYDILIILSILLFMVKFGRNFNTRWTFALDTFFIILVWFGILDRAEKDSDMLKNLVIVWALEVGLPIIFSSMTSAMPGLENNDFFRLYLTNQFLFPWWTYFFVFKSGGGTFLQRFLKWLIIIFWLGVGLSFAAVTITDINDPDYYKGEKMEAYTELWVRSKTVYQSMIENIGKGFSGVKRAVDRQMAFVSGDYYFGRVEQTKNAQIGVVIKDLKPIKKYFREDEEVIVSATAHGETLDDSIQVVPSCYVGDKDDRRGYTKGTIDPADPFFVENTYDQYLICTFPEWELTEGTHEINFDARFSFETMAYMKRYFMEKSAFNGMMSDGEDPLDFYKKTDKEPRAVFSNGPVAIGMGPENALIPVSDEGQQNNKIYITIDINTQSGWEGKIIQLNELLLQMPDSMRINSPVKDCTYPFTTYAVEDCVDGYIQYRSKQFMECLREIGYGYLDDDEIVDIQQNPDDVPGLYQCLGRECDRETEGYNMYSLDIQSDVRKFTNMEDYLTIICDYDVVDIDGLLNNNPIAEKYFRIKARYIFEVNEDINVKIREGSDPSGDPTPSRRVCKGDKKDVLLCVFNLFYREEPNPLKEYSKKYGIDPCVGASLISVLSAGDETKNQNGMLGLMQLTREEGGELLTEMDDEDFQRFLPMDASHNIRMGLYKYQKLMEKFDDQSLALAGFRAGEDAVDNACKNQDGSYKDYQDCADSPYIPSSESVISFVHTMEEYISECTEEKIVDLVGEIKEERYTKESEFVSGEDMLLAGDTTHYFWGQFNLKVSESGSEDDPDYTVRLLFGDQSIGSASTNRYDFSDTRYKKISSSFPLFKYRFIENEGNMYFSYRFIRDSVINSERMFEDEEYATGVYKYHIWENWISAKFDGQDLLLQEYGGSNFCRIDWISNGEEIYYGECKEKKGSPLFGLSATLIKNHIPDEEDRGDRAWTQVQFEYNPLKELSCCNECLPCSRWECQTCVDRCELNQNDVCVGQQEAVT
jgi:hypothetical protein